jgi:membrane-associated phospholipid phosphatase
MALIGYTLALLVAISRLMLGAHSPSEVVAGFVLGGLVVQLALHLSQHAQPFARAHLLGKLG